MPKPLSLSLAVLIVLAVLGTSLPVRAQSGTLADCLSGCRPGDDACIACCADAFPSEAARACLDDYGACANRCASLEGLKALMCQRACLDQARAALGPDAASAEFDCPHWVRPASCPDCQTWSPRQQKCVPAPKELCGQKE